MKMDRVGGEKRGGGGNTPRSIDISGIPQSVLERSVPSSSSSSSVGQLSPNGNGRLNLYLSDQQKSQPKSPGLVMTNGRNSHHHLYNSSESPNSSSVSNVAGLPLTKNVGVGVNLTQNRGTTSNGKQQQSFVAPQLPHGQLSGRGGTGGVQVQLSHSPTPPGSGMTNAILPELLQQGPSGRVGKSTSLVPSAASLVHLAKGGSLSSAQRDLFNNLNPNGNKIVSQNLNGTLAVTSVPTNDSELQLFRVLQRANLLNYFDVMIELGGDDVQQLCDAGEEEFLEIMALIGMASKPLHVRRLQKSLQDWMTQPSLFPGPVLGPPLSAFTGSLTPSQRDSSGATNTANNANNSTQPQMPIRPIPYHSGNSVPPSAASFLSPNELKSLHMKFLAMRNSSDHSQNSNNINQNNNSGSSGSSPINNQHSNPNMTSNSVIPIPFHGHSSPTLPNGNQGYPQYPNYSNSNGVGAQLRIPADQIIPSQFLETRIRTRSEPNSPAGSGSSSESPQLDSRTSLSPIPFLQDHEVQKIADAAVKVIQSLPDYMSEPRVSAKRKTCADFETVLRIPDVDVSRMDKVRKYAAIYGRYDCKRKVQKPLTIHELSVNEAASHLCNQVPALLTRRDELFLLSRQVVRDAGLPYSSIISSTTASLIPTIKTTKHQNTTRMEDVSNGSSNDSNNSSGYVGGKRLRLGDAIEIEEFNRPRSAPEIDTTGDESLVPTKPSTSSSDDQPSSFEEPETGRSTNIFGGGSPRFSPRYDPYEEVPDDLRINKRVHQSPKTSKTYKNHEVKSEPTSS